MHTAGASGDPIRPALTRDPFFMAGDSSWLLPGSLNEFDESSPGQGSIQEDGLMEALGAWK